MGMIIILKRITKKTGKYAIKEFLKPTLKGGLLTNRGFIENVSILALKDKEKDEVEYYSLVEIIPGAVAKRAIKKLDGKQLNGQKIGVSAYFVRNGRNEQRTNYRVGAKFLDKRKGDRRRPYLENIYLEIDEEGELKNGQFSRV